MTKTQILNYLELITDELTDAYHLTDREGSEEAFCSIDTARELIEELTNNIENNVTISDKEKHDFNEAMNGELMGPDRLPLNFPYNSGDGEGRLKGKN